MADNRIGARRLRQRLAELDRAARHRVPADVAASGHTAAANRLRGAQDVIDALGEWIDAQVGEDQ